MAKPVQTHPLLARAEHALRIGRSDEAIALLQQAHFQLPHNAGIAQDLGTLCLQTGRVREAIAAFRAALRANPRAAQSSLRLGIALQELGDDEAAIAAYQHAANLLPSLAEARFRAGSLLESRGQREAAIAAYRRAAASAPKTIVGRLSAARALMAEDRDQQAMRVLRQLIAVDAANAAANELLGLLLANQGEFDEARACYERAIAALPRLAGCYYDVVRCRRITSDDAELIARIKTALNTPGMPAEARLRIHLALGKIAEDFGDFATAMQHFDAADEVRAGFGGFDLTAFHARIERLIAEFTPQRVTQACQLGNPDATPILIVGLPRSGTKLVEQILSCHPNVHGAGELPFWTEAGVAWEQGGMEPRFAAVAATQYTQLLQTLNPAAGRITDKMPLNILWAGLIHLALPQATIIHCQRDPLDTALSIHRTYFNQFAAFPTGGTALVETVRAVERLATHWHTVLPPRRFIRLSYESLVTDPESVIRRLLSDCDLHWDSACLHPERNRRAMKTPSKWQARQPISPESVGAWRHYKPWLGPLAALLP